MASHAVAGSASFAVKARLWPYKSELTALTAGTTYYVRAYATNSAGTSYGNEVDFATANVDVGAAASFGIHAVANVNVVGAGQYSSALTGLDAGTDYHVRAYATSSVGTGYGDEVDFATAAGGGQSVIGYASLRVAAVATAVRQQNVALDLTADVVSASATIGVVNDTHWIGGTARFAVTAVATIAVKGAFAVSGAATLRVGAVASTGTRVVTVEGSASLVVGARLRTGAQVAAGMASFAVAARAHIVKVALDVTVGVPAIVPQLPSVLTCAQYEFSGNGQAGRWTDPVAVTAGRTYQVGPYAQTFSCYSTVCRLEAVLYAAGVETRAETIAELDGAAGWERYTVAVTPTGGEDGLALRVIFVPTDDGFMTTQITAMSIVAEPVSSAFFTGTRIDSGIYGDSTEAAPGLPNEIADGNGIWAWYGPHRLYEGWQMAAQRTYTSDERWYVPCASYIERGKRNELFGRVYKDSDIAQWQSMENVPSWASMTNSGDKFRILNTAGNPVPAADNGIVYPVVYYWLMQGLRTDIHIDSVTFTLTKVGTPLFTLGVVSWAVPPNPAAANVPHATELYTSATGDGAVTATPTGTPQAIGFYVKSTSGAGWTATVDNGWDVTAVSVLTSAGTVDLGIALADLAKLVGVAAGDALHTYTNETVSTLAARPVTTVSAAQDALVALAPVQLKWGYETKGIFDSAAAALPDRTNKLDRVRWWSLSTADCTFTSDVVTDNEDFYDAVAVMYGAISVAGVTDGTVRVLYRGPGGVVTVPTATTRVRVLDYSGRYMTEAEAMAVGDSWLLWNGAGTGARGTVNLSGDVRDVDGHVRPAIFIEPGDWVEERDRRGHTPWLVTGVSYDANGRVTVSIGGAERIFPNINPGIGGLYADAELGTWSATTETSGAESGALPNWSDPQAYTQGSGPPAPGWTYDAASNSWMLPDPNYVRVAPVSQTPSTGGTNPRYT